MFVLRTFLASTLVVLTAAVHGATLQFSSGSLSNGLVRLTASGPTNLVCELQRLNPTNDTWAAIGNFTLSSSGTYDITTTLPTDGYGYYRTKSTNGTYLSTNAFGAMWFTLPDGYSIVGNPFKPLHLTNVFLSPVDGMTVDRYASNTWTSVDSFDFGAWNQDDTIGRGEGAMVYCPATNVTAQFYGLFDTNSFSKTLDAGYSLLLTPLYHITSLSTMQVDSMTSSVPGGNSNLPIQSSLSPEAEYAVVIGNSGPTYNDYVLTNSVWKLNNTNVSSVPIQWSVGFWWRNTSTNSATWTINSIPIW